MKYTNEFDRFAPSRSCCVIGISFRKLGGVARIDADHPLDSPTGQRLATIQPKEMVLDYRLRTDATSEDFSQLRFPKGRLTQFSRRGT
jgi:hypothetical protein